MASVVASIQFTHRKADVAAAKHVQYSLLHMERASDLVLVRMVHKRNLGYKSMPSHLVLGRQKNYAKEGLLFFTSFAPFFLKAVLISPVS